MKISLSRKTWQSIELGMKRIGNEFTSKVATAISKELALTEGGPVSLESTEEKWAKVLSYCLSHGVRGGLEIQQEMTLQSFQKPVEEEFELGCTREEFLQEQEEFEAEKRRQAEEAKRIEAEKQKQRALF